MKRLLPTKLNPSDRQQLAALTYHAGFKVLQHLMELRVQHATVQMLEVAPDDKDRTQKISDLQAQAYARNAFCEELLNDINWQVKQELADQEEDEEPELDATQQALITAATQMGFFTPTGE